MYQAWEFGYGIGSANVVFDEEGNVVECSGRIVFPFDSVNYDPEIKDEAIALLLTEFLEETGSYVATEPDAETAAALEIYTNITDDIIGVVIADVPEDICYDRTPGSGYSLVCPVEETMVQGGGVCNLVSQGWMSEVPTADITITNAGGCRQDIFQGGRL